MAIERCVETRMMEGVRRDFLADADVVDFVKSRVEVGPLFDDPISIVAPQINIALLTADGFEAGAGGVSKERIGIFVKAYFHQESLTVGGINPQDYVTRLKTIIAKGSIDPYTGITNGNGWLLDPDYVLAEPLPTPDDPLRWLNTYWHGCTNQPALPMKGTGLIVIPFAIDYETMLDTLTRQRVN